MTADLAKLVESEDFTGLEKDVRNGFEVLGLRLNMPEGILKLAKNIYSQKVLNNFRVFSRNKLQDVAAACIYAAYMLAETPVTIESIAEVCYGKESKRNILRIYKRIKYGEKLEMMTPTSSNYLANLSKKLEIPDYTVVRAGEIINSAAGYSHGSQPVSVAATAIYLACSETGAVRTQKEIEAASGVTSVTIRNTLKKMKRIYTE